MTARPDALDQSWGYADPAAAQAAGIEYVSMYLSWEPSKNITAAKVRAYHRHGIAVGANWESQAGAPLKGAAQGRADAAEAVRQMRDLINEVGYAPRNKVAITFSCDRDVTASQYPQIEAYYRAAREIVHAAGFLVGVYGEAALVSHLHAVGLTDFEWQTVAWSGGVVSPQADLYQYAINQTFGGASVDFDRIIHPAEIGAWWPPGNPLNSEDDMPITDADAAKIAEAVAQHKVKIWNGSTPTLAALWSNSHETAHATLDAASAALALAKALTPRVASLQAAVALLAPRVASVDVAAVVDGVAAKLRAVTWRAS